MIYARFAARALVGLVREVGRGKGDGMAGADNRYRLNAGLGPTKNHPWSMSGKQK